MSMPVTPWWEVLKLRDEIAALVRVDRRRADVAVPGGSRHRGLTARPMPTQSTTGRSPIPRPLFIDLMAKVAVRLGGGENYTRARALWRLDQAMGGGKSHGLIGLCHLAAHPAALASDRRRAGRHSRRRQRSSMAASARTWTRRRSSCWRVTT